MEPQQITANRNPIDRPEAEAVATPASTEDRIRRVLELIRPSIQADGGDLEYVGFRDGIVQVRLHGACVGCPSSELTLQMGIEQNLREHIPEVEKLEAVA